MIRRSCGGSGLLKQVMMADGELSPLVRELIIRVSTANGCGYCIHSHGGGGQGQGHDRRPARRLLA